MPDVNARDAKLIQYLNEAHTKERQLEQALEAHIAMTEIATYRKRLQQHLTETKRHAREVERRIKQLGGKAEGIGGVVQEAAGRAQDVAARGAALAQGQVHMLRGTGPQEKMLKNAKTEFQSEAEEIGTYTAIADAGEDRRRPRDRAAREGDPARGEAHGGIPREADPEADPGGREGRDPGLPAQRRAADARSRRRTTSRSAHDARRQPQRHHARRRPPAATSRKTHRARAAATSRARSATRVAQRHGSRTRHGRARRTAASGCALEVSTLALTGGALTGAAGTTLPSGAASWPSRTGRGSRPA